jgi:predicted membrane channel-forming protein YqfA (hemolysin III family)
MKLFLKGLIRGTLPFAVMLSMYAWNNFQGNADDAKAFLFYGFMAFFLGLASIIYEIKQWSFRKQIMAHYLTMLVTVFPLLLLSGYYKTGSFGAVLHVFLQFNKAGIILFVTTAIISKIRNRLMNLKQTDL